MSLTAIGHAPSDDQQVLDAAAGWLADGDPVVLAVLVSTWGSAPRGVGSYMAVREDGLFAGSVSGGCIEAAVVEAAQDLGRPIQVMDFAIDDDTARRAGLPCGGNVVVALIRPDSVLLARLAQRTAQRQPAALVIDLATGQQTLVDPVGNHGHLALSPEVMADIGQRLASGQSGCPSEGLFARIHEPATVLVVVGAVHVTQSLVAMAELVGFKVVVVDPRRAFATPERFPGATLISRQPEEALPELILDSRTAIVTLAHVAALDDATLIRGLDSDAFYVGALGSRRTHAKRLQRLAGLGVGAEALARIHAPVGLDIGAANPAEIAVSVLAQIIAARRGKPSQRTS
ncbi:MAG: XdhC family protein [Alphaproteobacteria bacterium]|nr:XdhC family protein [Alphaproteobacteria bacterium]